MNNTNNALETLVQRDKQIKKTNDKLKASINELEAELSTHASNTDIHTSKEELIKFIVDHLESLDLGITKEVVSVLPTENISDNTLYFVPNDKGSHNEYLYINDKWELVGSTKTNFTDYYTKQETNTLLEDKANSKHTHVVKDITDFPTIPTKTSQLINDSGFLTSSSGVITSVNWSDITNKPNFSTVATSGSYNDLSNKPTIPNVYNKTLTIQKNGTNVATFTSNSNTDVTANITVPTKVSELSNDSGYITSVSWEDVTSKPELSQVAISGSYTDLSNTPAIPTKLSQLENDMGFGTGGDTSDCVHKTGNETIDGTKTFTSMLKIAQGTLQVGSDAGYSVTYDWTGSIVSKQPSGTYNIFLPNANGTLALDENLVHTSGNETIAGFKSFTEVLDRRNDVTISTVATATQLVDTNANRCGWIANRMHWAGNYHVQNRHIAYNENSGKEVYIDIISSNDGSGGLFVSGTAINRNLTDVTSDTGHNALATMGWVNNPATSTNVVHRSGDEYIGGTKTFFSKIVGNLQGNADTAGNGVDSYGGSWIRFKNGIQMCWGSGVFEQMYSYPKAFNSGPKLVCTPASSEPQSLVVNFCYKTHIQFACRLWNVHTQGWQTNGSFDWIAIGTW